MKLDVIGNILEFEAGGKIINFSKKVKDEIDNIQISFYPQANAQYISILFQEYAIHINEADKNLSLSLHKIDRENNFEHENISRKLFNYSHEKLKERFDFEEEYSNFVKSFGLFVDDGDIKFFTTASYSKYESLTTILSYAFEIIVDEKISFNIMPKSEKLIQEFLKNENK